MNLLNRTEGKVWKFADDNSTAVILKRKKDN